MNGLDAPGGVFVFLESDVDAEGMVLTVGGFPVGNGDLLDDAVLPKVFWPPKRLEQLVFPAARCNAGHVNEVLLDHAYTDEVLPGFFLNLTLLRFLLLLFLSTFLLVLLDVSRKVGRSARRVSNASLQEMLWGKGACRLTPRETQSYTGLSFRRRVVGTLGKARSCYF